MRRLKRFVLAASLALSPLTVRAQNVLIIDSPISSVNSNLKSLQQSAGYNVTSAPTIPSTFSGFSQIWDLRAFDALTTSQQGAYLTYLQAGGRVFVMGENAAPSFVARNNSIFSLIGAAGGGNVALGGGLCSNDTQTANAPFTGPNFLSIVTYQCAGNFDNMGTGQWITNAGNIGAGVAWGFGTLANAKAGSLTSILDINFLSGTGSSVEQALVKNLVGFVNNQVPTAPVPGSPPPTSTVPEPSTYALMACGLAAIGILSQRRRHTNSGTLV